MRKVAAVKTSLWLSLSNEAADRLESLAKFKLLAVTAGSVCSGYAEWVKVGRCGLPKEIARCADRASPQLVAAIVAQAVAVLTGCGERMKFLAALTLRGKANKLSL